MAASAGECDAAPSGRGRMAAAAAGGAALLLVGLVAVAAVPAAGQLPVPANQDRRLQACGSFQWGFDLKTHKQLPPFHGVPSAQACKEKCAAMAGCGAWTWGQAQGMPGISHVCFPKGLHPGEQPRKLGKQGLVSGVLCPKGPAAPASKPAPAAPPQAGSCAQLHGVDFGTKAQLKPLAHVSSAQSCQASCLAAPGCKAWTWGEMRNSPGLTDMCFLKKLSPGEQPFHIQKKGVISGLACQNGVATQQQPAQRPALTPATAQGSGKSRSDLLYCFTYAAAGSVQSRLVLAQHREQAGIFACDESSVYSNEGFGKDKGLHVREVASPKGGGGTEAERSRRLYRAVWHQVVEEGTFWLFSWAAKVEPEAVFFPDRLRPLLAGFKNELEAHQHGLYLNNCRYGMMGALEVLSSAAVQALGDGWAQCEKHFEGFGAVSSLWGEALFIDQCLSEVQEVRREYNGGLLRDGSCGPPPSGGGGGSWSVLRSVPEPKGSCQGGAVAFHPYRDLPGFLACLHAGGGQAAGPMVFK